MHAADCHERSSIRLHVPKHGSRALEHTKIEIVAGDCTCDLGSVPLDATAVRCDYCDQGLCVRAYVDLVIAALDLLASQIGIAPVVGGGTAYDGATLRAWRSVTSRFTTLSTLSEGGDASKVCKSPGLTRISRATADSGTPKCPFITFRLSAMTSGFSFAISTTGGIKKGPHQPRGLIFTHRSSSGAE